MDYKKEIVKLLQKELKIKIAAPITKENLPVVQSISKIAEVKHNNKINSRFVLVDNKELMFMILNDEEVHPTYDIGIWVNTPYFATAMENLFNVSWKNMEPADKAVSSVK